MRLSDRLKNINRLSVIKNSFLIPILLVVIISVSHVTSWYDLGNPMSWAIYLSVAIEIFALASVSAASVNINRASVWFLFGLVTSIQIVGNIFFGYNDINVTDKLFLSWMELIQPLFEDWDVTDHRRFLAAIQGGSLPLMSLTALHYYIKFGDRMKQLDLDKPATVVHPVESAPVEEQVIPIEESTQAIQSDTNTSAEPTTDGDIAPYTNNFE